MVAHVSSYLSSTAAGPRSDVDVEVRPAERTARGIDLDSGELGLRCRPQCRDGPDRKDADLKPVNVQDGRHRILTYPLGYCHAVAVGLSRGEPRSVGTRERAAGSP